MKRFIFFTFIGVILLGFTAGAQDKQSTTAPIKKDWNRPPNYTEGMIPLPDKEKLVPVKAAPEESPGGSVPKEPVKLKPADAPKNPPLKIRANKNPGK
jgi:hypothetical protein